MFVPQHIKNDAITEAFETGKLVVKSTNIFTYYSMDVVTKKLYPVKILSGGRLKLPFYHDNFYYLQKYLDVLYLYHRGPIPNGCYPTMEAADLNTLHLRRRTAHKGIDQDCSRNCTFSVDAIVNDTVILQLRKEFRTRIDCPAGQIIKEYSDHLKVSESSLRRVFSGVTRDHVDNQEPPVGRKEIVMRLQLVAQQVREKKKQCKKQKA